jgi:hypothetical protein
MCREAAAAGFYLSPWGKHERLQLLTVKELLEGQRIDMPPPQLTNVTYQQAPKAKRRRDTPQQGALFDEE